MRRFEALLFDLDGTLVDSLGGITAALNEALGSAGRPEVSPERVRGIVGDGPRRLCARALGAAPDDVVERVLARFRERYAELPVRDSRPFPGVPEILDDLGGRPAAVVTNKGRRVAEQVLRAFGIESRVRLLVAEDDLPWRKPDPRPLLHAAERLGATAGRTLLVGDGQQDLEAARAAGTACCAVLQGYDRERVLALAPEWTLERIAELPEWLRRVDPT